MTQPRNERLRGVSFLSAGIAVFSIQDVILKLLSGSYPLSEAMTIRSLTAVPLLWLLVLADGGPGSLRTRHTGFLILRGLLNLTSYSGYYLALAALPMASCVALFFTAPLFIAGLSVVFLKERVDLSRWLAVIVGFLGVFIVMQPGSDVFDWASVLPVGAAFTYSLAQVIARRVGDSAGAAVMSFYSNGMFLAGALVMAALFGFDGDHEAVHRSLGFLLRDWAVPRMGDLLLLAGCGLVAAAAQPMLAQAYRIAPANVVAPFEYTAIVWAVLYGWLVWGQLPNGLAWAGIVLIMAAGLFVMRRERAPSDRGGLARPLHSITGADGLDEGKP
jgi:drug/metabolite transporter (DMT)-like permease